MTFARELLEAKLALEAELARPLYAWGVRYIEAWGSTLGNIGAHDKLQAITALELILTRHYARVTMVMQGRRPPSNPTLADAAPLRRHHLALANQVKKNAALIVASIDRDLMRGLTSTALFDANEPVDDGTKAFNIDVEVKDSRRQPGVWGVSSGYAIRMKDIVAKTLDKWKAKLKTIVTANTNGVSEASRAEQVLEIVPDGQQNVRLVKVWNSLLDGRERHAHHVAHGQEVPVESAFTVGGELLRFPGDAELGASLGMICNCRCFLSHYAVKPDGTRTPLHTGPSAPTRRYRKPQDTKPPVLKPTSVVTLNNGRTNARVVLGDGATFATLRQTTPSTIEVLINRRVVARAQIVNGRAVNITETSGTNPAYDIAGLIRRSVEASARMDRRPFSQRP